MDKLDWDYKQLVYDTQKRVHFIKWNEIPKGDYVIVLQNIPIGDYVYRLPYSDVVSKSFRIAIPNRRPIRVGNVNTTVTTSCAYIEFIREKMTDEYGYPDVAWMRER